MWLHDPGLFTRSIAAMVTPRKMSSEARRCRVLVGAISIAGNSAGAGGAGRVSVSSSGGAVAVVRPAAAVRAAGGAAGAIVPAPAIGGRAAVTVHVLVFVVTSDQADAADSQRGDGRIVEELAHNVILSRMN